MLVCCSLCCVEVSYKRVLVDGEVSFDSFHGVFAAAVDASACGLNKSHRGFYYELLLLFKNEEAAIASKISRLYTHGPFKRENTSIMAVHAHCNFMPKISSRKCVYCIFIIFYYSERDYLEG